MPEGVRLKVTHRHELPSLRPDKIASFAGSVLIAEG